jgi:hypothetical protein
MALSKRRSSSLWTKKSSVPSKWMSAHRVTQLSSQWRKVLTITCCPGFLQRRTAPRILSAARGLSVRSLEDHLKCRIHPLINCSSGQRASLVSPIAGRRSAIWRLREPGAMERSARQGGLRWAGSPAASSPTGPRPNAPSSWPICTTWPSLRKAFTRPTASACRPATRSRPPAGHRRRPPAQRAASHRVPGPGVGGAHPGALPARERPEAELYEWVRRDEECATLGANVVVELYSESHAVGQPRLGQERGDGGRCPLTLVGRTRRTATRVQPGAVGLCVTGVPVLGSTQPPIPPMTREVRLFSHR